MDNTSCVDPKVDQIPLKDLKTDSNQPRQYFDPDKLAELTESIRMNGIITPLLYRVDGEQKTLVSGECRYKAALELNLETVPAQKVLRDYEFVALAENINRKSLTPMEQCKAVSKLNNKHGNQADIAKKLGLAESTISEILTPSKLPEDMQTEALKSGFWSRNKLLQLTKVKKPDEQRKLFEKMKDDVVKKDALKQKKREAKNNSTKQEKPKIDVETKKANATDRKIKAIKKSAALFSQKIKKELENKWDSREKKQLKKELQDVVDIIHKFLGEKNEEATLSES